MVSNDQLNPAQREPAAPGEDDIALLVAARSGDAGAFERLVKKHHASVYRLALAMTRNPRDAEEVSQETFVDVRKKLSSFAKEPALRTWLFRIATNYALLRQRKQRHQQQSLREHALPQFRLSGAAEKVPANWSAQALKDADGGKLVDDALLALPEKYRNMLVLKDGEALSLTDVAWVLGMSVETVKSIVHRARLAVFERLAQHYDQPVGQQLGQQVDKGAK